MVVRSGANPAEVGGRGAWPRSALRLLGGFQNTGGWGQGASQVPVIGEMLGLP